MHRTIIILIRLELKSLSFLENPKINTFICWISLEIKYYILKIKSPDQKAANYWINLFKS